MNKIAEDIIFLKDNWDLIDNRTYESLQAKKKSIKKSKEPKGLKTIILVIIVFIGWNIIFSDIDTGIIYSALFALTPLVCTYRKNVEYVLSMILTVFVSTIMINVFDLSVNDMALTVVVVIATGIITGIITRIIVSKRRKSSSPILLPEEEDEITKKLYTMLEEYGISTNYLEWGRRMYKIVGSEYDGVSDLERRIRLMEDFDSSEKVQYPIAKVPEKNNLNREVLVSKLIDSNLFKDILHKLDGDDLLDILKKKSDDIYVNNDEREKYLNIMIKLLEKIPKNKFDIPMVATIGRERQQIYWTYWNGNKKAVPFSYPNLSRSIAPIIQSDEYKELKKLDNFYKEQLKQFNNDLKGTLIGAEGEREVLKTLTDFAEISGKDKIRILPNIRLEPNGKSVESDFIVVCPNGVFALEVKNLGSTGSYNITVEKDGLWKKVMKNGRWKQMPDSISRQNERHLMGIEQVINSQMGNSIENWIEAKSLIVFANNVVGIRNYSNNVIIRDSEIMTEIRKHPICLNEQQINQIAEILIAESLPAKKYKMENWMDRLVAVHLELAQRTHDIYPYLQEYIEIANVYNYKLLDNISQLSYQVTQEKFSLADDESEYQKSAEELEYERKVEQVREMEQERMVREREESYQYNNQSVYEEEPTWEERFHTYDAYQYGTAINMDYQDSCDKNKNQ